MNNNNNNDSSGGTYTTLTRLAAQLEGPKEPPPMISIETDSSAILVKEYDGHTIAIQVPRVANESSEESSWVLMSAYLEEVCSLRKVDIWIYLRSGVGVRKEKIVP